MKKNGFYFHIFLFIIWLSSYPTTFLFAQTANADTIRYHSGFTGIGPKVYNLPAPQSKQEILAKGYEIKQVEAPKIDSLLDKQQFFLQLKELFYAPVGPASSLKSEQDLQRIINGHLFSGKLGEAAGAQNSLAIMMVSKDNYEKATSLFEEALKGKQATNDQLSELTILQNLALYKQYLGKNVQAINYFEQSLAIAQKLKDKRAQAQALVGISLEMARQQHYEEAERTIIRKAIPLFKSAHDVAGHIGAFKSLATIYEMQQKYAQASWFYLQAKKIALPGQVNSGEMAYIFYNLAHIKYLIGDFKLAILDYKSAESIARKNNLIPLQLAIQDVLGEIYNQTGDYTAAVLALNEYNNLKNKILESQNDQHTGI
ncbi:Tetratricopeptide repeat-containing protein [bacterium A37T11]|nr:Tetratricopeptide repeat-containing protein [bacterium A37T11]